MTLHPGPTRSRVLSIHQSAQLLGIVADGRYGGLGGRPDYGFVTAFLNMTGGVSAGVAMLLAGVYKSTLRLAGVMARAIALAGLAGIALLVGVRSFFWQGTGLAAGACQ